MLLYQVEGAWNEEGARGFSRATSRLVEPLIEAPWAVLGDLSNWQLATLDCIPRIGKLTEASIRSNCVLQCLLPGEGQLKHDCIVKMVPAALPGFERHFVDGFEAAEAVLQQRGFAEEARMLHQHGFHSLIKDPRQVQIGAAS
jgi:hypothetical protein